VFLDAHECATAEFKSVLGVYFILSLREKRSLLAYHGVVAVTRLQLGGHFSFAVPRAIAALLSNVPMPMAQLD
jgi:hypothetical protein